MPAGIPLTVLPGELAVCRLPPDAPFPAWADGPGFLSLTRTAEELSVVCLADRVPDGVQAVAPWRALKVEGPLDFALTGILAALARPLAEAGISLFAVATYDTDYLLVKADMLDAAVAALRGAGHAVIG
ncbi:ACT domain-containing protein [Aerophototrophica crusticola]|uniref:ACT domain-containing protein n=1 Tax=Aerophototrophica crusticola TaxID=1709002 RepID=A0A858RAD1_9PROT|nr:ACT domain-containing protein [Rhodospirillaceae bacterium B3]